MNNFITYNIDVIDNSIIYKTTILENLKSVMTTCTCNGSQKCKHVVYALSGYKEFIADKSHEIQEKMIERLNTTKEGLMIINQSKNRSISYNRRKLSKNGLLRTFKKLIGK